MKRREGYFHESTIREKMLKPNFTASGHFTDPSNEETTIDGAVLYIIPLKGGPL